MDSLGSLVTSVVNYVLTKRNGHTPTRHEHVSCLTLPFYVEGFKVFKILDVNDLGLVREHQQDLDNAVSESDGTVFEVNIYNRGYTRFYYVVSGFRFVLVAQEGESIQTIGWHLKHWRGSPAERTPESEYENLQLDEWFQGEEEEEVTTLDIAVAVARLIIIPGVDPKTARKLANAGFDTIEKVSNANKNDLADAIADLNIMKAEDITTQAVCLLEKIETGDLGPNGWSKPSTEKPVRVIKLAPLPAPKKKPVKIALPEVGSCTFCSGTLVMKKGKKICQQCGKMERAIRGADDDWHERSAKLRRELRR